MNIFLFIVGIAIGYAALLIQVMIKHKNRINHFRNEIENIKSTYSKNEQGQYPKHIFFQLNNYISIINEYESNII